MCTLHCLKLAVSAEYVNTTPTHSTQDTHRDTELNRIPSTPRPYESPDQGSSASTASQAPSPPTEATIRPPQSKPPAALTALCTFNCLLFCIVYCVNFNLAQSL